MTAPVVLVAPDKFRGSLSASGVSQAVAAGIAEVAPDVAICTLPVADGGEGTVVAAVAAGFEPVRAPGSGARFAMCEGTAVLEVASVCGHPPAGAPHDPTTASTWAFGALVSAALDLGARRLVLALGGSATTDGGAGMLQALGYRLLDERGRHLPPGGAALVRLRTVDARQRDPRLEGIEIVVAHDVDNPLLGSDGAARAYGPQKGASPDEVAVLEAGLTRWADVSAAVTDRDLAGCAGAGAAGGTGFAALTHLGATARPGAELLLELVGFHDRLATASLVVTGEGHLDEQSLRGKAPVVVARAAARRGVPAVAVAGRCSLGAEQLRQVGLHRAHALTPDQVDEDVALRCAYTLLRRTGATIANEWLAVRAGS